MPSRWRRLATEVEAQELTEPRDLHLADLWLRAHGVETAHRHPALSRRGLLVPTGPGDLFAVARLGQWLTHDLATGGFDVTDDAVFRLVHRPA